MHRRFLEYIMDDKNTYLISCEKCSYLISNRYLSLHFYKNEVTATCYHQQVITIINIGLRRTCYRACSLAISIPHYLLLSV